MTNSWHLPHHSEYVPRGDYQSLVLPDNVRWGARVIIPHEDGIIAVKHTFPDHSNWVLPGGGVEKGETVPQAAIREVQEETHLTVKPERLLYVRLFYFPERTHQVVEFYVLARIVDGTFALGSDPEIDDVHQILTDIRVLTWDELANDDDLTFYPIFMRKRLQRDIQTPPTTALYMGTTP
ncbi:MAG: NUDIX hydrolase [Chloroflexota bacterium]